MPLCGCRDPGSRPGPHAPQVNECALRGDTWLVVGRAIKRHKHLDKVGTARGGGVGWGRGTPGGERRASTCAAS